MRRPDEGTCRSCGKPIVWIRTISGKAMPCDPELRQIDTLDHSRTITVTLVTGETFRGRPVSAATVGATIVEGYESHFASCEHADQHRKRVYREGG